MRPSSRATTRASRINGTLSSGPFTGLGKQRSAAPAICYGLYSNQAFLPNESPNTFEYLIRHHVDGLQPRNLLLGFNFLLLKVVNDFFIPPASLRKSKDLESLRVCFRHPSQPDCQTARPALAPSSRPTRRDETEENRPTCHASPIPCTTVHNNRPVPAPSDSVYNPKTEENRATCHLLPPPAPNEAPGNLMMYY